MKPASLKEIKDEIKHLSQPELMDLVLRLGRFKAENKELLTYVLFDSYNEAEFIRKVQEEMEVDFADMNRSSYFFMKKTIRKVLRNLKKAVRYSKKKETEVELLIHFCSLMKSMTPPMEHSRVLFGIYMRQYALLEKAVKTLHEDIQDDYYPELDKLKFS